MQATIQYIEKELADHYPKSEVKGFVRLIFESVCGWNYSEQILKRNERVNSPEITRVKEIVQSLKVYEPIQYILGETEFYGLNLKVTPSVLIPRPETEELVQWVIEMNSFDAPRILDIGTGSACIALGIKSQISSANIHGVDISDKALEIANENAILNNLDVNFFQVDILNWEKYNWGSYDIIVSNPPYVREIEKPQIQPNVLKYEPENALFVSNDNPLIFYSRIADFAQSYLVNNGNLFFEINEYLGEEMCNLLKHKGFVDVELKKDINNKNRMLFCRKKK